MRILPSAYKNVNGAIFHFCQYRVIPLKIISSVAEAARILQEETQMHEKITVAVIGMGGYGINYVKAILNKGDALGTECLAMVDIRPEECRVPRRKPGLPFSQRQFP